MEHRRQHLRFGVTLCFVLVICAKTQYIDNDAVTDTTMTADDNATYTDITVITDSLPTSNDTEMTDIVVDPTTPSDNLTMEPTTDGITEVVYLNETDTTEPTTDPITIDPDLNSSSSAPEPVTSEPTTDPITIDPDLNSSSSAPDPVTSETTVDATTDILINSSMTTDSDDVSPTTEGDNVTLATPTETPQENITDTETTETTRATTDTSTQGSSSSSSSSPPSSSTTSGSPQTSQSSPSQGQTSHSSSAQSTSTATQASTSPTSGNSVSTTTQVSVSSETTQSQTSPSSTTSSGETSQSGTSLMPGPTSSSASPNTDTTTSQTPQSSTTSPQDPTDSSTSPNTGTTTSQTPQSSITSPQGPTGSSTNPSVDSTTTGQTFSSTSLSGGTVPQNNPTTFPDTATTTTHTMGSASTFSLGVETTQPTTVSPDNTTTELGSPDTDEPPTGTAMDNVTTTSPAETDTSTASTQSSTASPTTSAIPEGFQPPNEDAVYRIRMVLGIIKPLDPDLLNKESSAFSELAMEIQSKINAIFYGGVSDGQAPVGFAGVVVNGFRRYQVPQNNIAYFNNQAATSIQTTLRENDTITDYDITYSVFSLENKQVDQLQTYIAGDFTASVTTETFDEAAVDGAFLDDYNIDPNGLTAQMALLNESIADECLVEDICQDCSQCVTGQGCQTECIKDGEQCSTDGVTCECDSEHVGILDDCVSKNVVIGVSAGVGGAILVALIIGLVVLGVSRKRMADKLGDGDSFSYELGSSSIARHQKTGFTNPLMYDVATGHNDMPSPEPRADDEGDRFEPTLDMIRHTSAYTSFSPSVAHVDPTKDYFADRPVITFRRSFTSSKRSEDEGVPIDYFSKGSSKKSTL